MTGFGSVDTSPDPARLVKFVNEAATAEWGMKHYAAAAHALRHPSRPILDVGCGGGHDLAILASFGLTAVGVDPSTTMLEAAKPRTAVPGAGLVRGTADALPFRDGIFSGCRIERVLMHVAVPPFVLSEAVRCVQPGGLVTVFEPDWGRFEIESEMLPSRASWISVARHPGIGGKLPELLHEAGCDVLDRVEELSIWRSLATLERVAGFPESVERAVTLGRLDRHEAKRWVDEQRGRGAAGTFRATIPKILVVAQKADQR